MYFWWCNILSRHLYCCIMQCYYNIENRVKANSSELT